MGPVLPELLFTLTICNLFLLESTRMHVDASTFSSSHMFARSVACLLFGRLAPSDLSDCCLRCAQFSKNEDFDKYPHQRQKDRHMLQEAGCAAVFEPSSLYFSRALSLL